MIALVDHLMGTWGLSGGELEVGSMYEGSKYVELLILGCTHRWADFSFGLISIWVTMIWAD